MKLRIISAVLYYMSSLLQSKKIKKLLLKKMYLLSKNIALNLFIIISLIWISLFQTAP